MTITHRIDGDGPPIILLNGGLMTIASWEPIAAPLAPSRRVIRCDFRGQLLTPGPYPSTLEEHADDVIALLDSLGIESAHVAGASFGAEIAMVLAARAPRRVERLTIVTATEKTTEAMRRDARETADLAEQAASGDGEAGKQMFRRVLSNTWSAAWVAAQPAGFFEARIAQAPLLPAPYYLGAAALLRLLETLDLTPILGSITAPTLVVGGGEDRVFPPEHSHAIARGIANAQLEILPGAPHGLLIERADRIVAMLG